MGTLDQDRKRKLSLPCSSIQSVLDQLRLMGITILPITSAHILRTETLPHHHGNPFDRMIIAQALTDIFATYGVQALLGTA